MKITIRAKNEYPVVPDIWDNMSLQDNQRFKVIMQKINGTAHSGEWTSFDNNGNMHIHLDKKLRKHMLRLVNPPTLRIDNEERALTIDDIVCLDKYPEIFELTNILVSEMNKLGDSDIDKKK